MARNAELERQLQATGECSCEAWEAREHPQAKRFAALLSEAEASAKALEILSRAAGYNPRKPPKG